MCFNHEEGKNAPMAPAKQTKDGPSAQFRRLANRAEKEKQQRPNTNGPFFFLQVRNPNMAGKTIRKQPQLYMWRVPLLDSTWPQICFDCNRDPASSVISCMFLLGFDKLKKSLCVCVCVHVTACSIGRHLKEFDCMSYIRLAHLVGCLGLSETYRCFKINDESFCSGPTKRKQVFPPEALAQPGGGSCVA